MAQQKMVRIDLNLYNHIDEMGARMNIPAARMIAILLRQGYDNAIENGIKIPENNIGQHEIDVESIVNKGVEAAKIGTTNLNKFLSTLTGTEEYRIKYCLKDWRRIAANADAKAATFYLRDHKMHGDRICLKGTTVYESWFKALHPAVQKALEPFTRGWIWEAKHSDFNAKRPSGIRHTQRRWFNQNGSSLEDENALLESIIKGGGVPADSSEAQEPAPAVNEPDSDDEDEAAILAEIEGKSAALNDMIVKK